MKFDLNAYRGKYAIHCETQEQAECFLSVLEKDGRTWCNGMAYLPDNSCWNTYKNATCYSFNDGTYSDYHYFKNEDSRYTVLEFEDFEWEGFHTPEYDTSVIDDFLMGFQTA